MSRHLAAVPRPSTPTERRITKAEVAEHYSTHPASVDRWVDLGCPAIDISVQRPGARPKRNLRFDLGEVESWLRGRS